MTSKEPLVSLLAALIISVPARKWRLKNSRRMSHVGPRAHQVRPHVPAITRVYARQTNMNVFDTEYISIMEQIQSKICSGEVQAAVEQTYFKETCSSPSICYLTPFCTQWCRWHPSPAHIGQSQGINPKEITLTLSLTPGDDLESPIDLNLLVFRP